MITAFQAQLQRIIPASLRRWFVVPAAIMVSSALAACLDNELDPDQVEQESSADAGIPSDDGDAGDRGANDAGGANGANGQGAPAAEKKLFIAQNKDFKDFKDWTTFRREVQGEHEGLSGVMTIYVSQAPDTEKKTFPVGTILFKTTEVEGFDKPVIHAMAKRGSGFNAAGAIGWEYFELLMGKNDVPAILWRGAKPPAGEMYQALLGSANVQRPMTTDADCNSCHAKGTDGALGDDALDLLNGQ